MITAVKLLLGGYFVLTPAIAAFRLVVYGRTDDARLDASLLISVLAIMAMAAPLLTLGTVMPGTIDDLTLAVVGITFAALSKPEPSSMPDASEPLTQ